MGLLCIITTTHHTVEERPGIDVPGAIGGIS
jgi:hypothetical protein